MGAANMAVCVCLHVHARVRSCVRAYVCVCVCVHAYVCACATQLCNCVLDYVYLSNVSCSFNVFIHVSCA